MFKGHFQTSAAHLEGCQIAVAARGSKITTIGSDDTLVFTDGANRGFMELKNKQKHQVTAMDIVPGDDEHVKLIVGTKEGLVLELLQGELDSAELIYKCETRIAQIKMSEKGRYILIVGSEQSIVLYECSKRRFKLFPSLHEGLLLKAYITESEEFCCSIGSEGKLHVYSLAMVKHERMVNEGEEDSDDPFANYVQQSLQIRLLDKYTVATEAIMRVCPVEGTFNYSDADTVFLVGGQSTLQKVNINCEDKLSEYHLHFPVREQSQICLTCMVSPCRNILAVTTRQNLSVWEYKSGEKLLNIKCNEIGSKDNLTMSCMLRFLAGNEESFFFVCNADSSDGNIYKFIRFDLLHTNTVGQDKVQGVPMAIEQSKPLPSINPQTVPQESISASIIVQYPQLSLEKSYLEYRGHRFLYNNQFGCVIETSEGDNSQLELQFHDRSRITRIKIKNSHRSFCYFALTNSTFVYASATQVIFQDQKQKREGYEWDISWNDITGVCLGAAWLAVSNKEEIKVFDFGGNELHSICIDRQVVALEAYEDKLVVVYHADIPMWGCQSQKIRWYTIKQNGYRYLRDVLLPLHPNELLKWVGFSEEGMLFIQDEQQFLRCYDYASDSWTVVLGLDPEKQKLFIQHIHQYEIYGFKIEQKDGEHQEPKVIPRSLPRRLPLALPQQFKFEFFEGDEQSILSRLQLKRLILRHESYRNEEWFKYKYSRTKEHASYEMSSSIYSSLELESAKLHFDTQLHDYLKKLVSRLAAKALQSQDPSLDVPHKLGFLCERLAFYSETATKLREIIESSLKAKPGKLKNFQFRYLENHKQPKSKISEISWMEKTSVQESSE